MHRLSHTPGSKPFPARASLAATRWAWALALPAFVCFATGCLGRSEVGLASRDPAERVRAMADAAASNDASAIPGLIERLSSEDPGERLLAIRALERLTGETRGYDHAGPPRQRDAAAKAWAQWWQARPSEAAR